VLRSDGALDYRRQSRGVAPSQMCTRPPAGVRGPAATRMSRERAQISPRPPFGLLELLVAVHASPHLVSVLQENRKSANIHTTFGSHLGIPPRRRGSRHAQEARLLAHEFRQTMGGRLKFVRTALIGETFVQRTSCILPGLRRNE
jgi:hypothetical protein